MRMRFSVLPFFVISFLLAELSPLQICRAGGAGNALEFDGNDDIVRVPFGPSLALTTSMTLEAWVFPLADDAGGVAGMWGNGGLADKFLMYFQDGTVTALISRANVPGLVSIEAFVPLNAWSHIAMTYDGASLILYVNGTESALADAPGMLPDVVLDFRMGVEDIVLGPGSFFEGSLDEVRLWNVARTPAEIDDSYQLVLSPSTPGLVGYWNMNESPGEQTVFDLAAGNDGTLGSDDQMGADDPGRVTSSAPVMVAAGAEFVRGDADGSGAFSGLVDGLFVLSFQFVPGSPVPPCLEAADADNDGSFSGLVDGLFMLNFQFVPGSPPIPFPFPDCGPDDDDAVGCVSPPGFCL